MTLVNLKDALLQAELSGYAIGAFNLTGEDMLLGILDAAVDARSPVILAIAEAHLPFMRWKSFMKMVIEEAENASVPVVVHLDHASRFETIYKAFQLGFTSVMYDGSVLSFSENITNTQHIVKIAHSLDVSVEAELGHIVGTSDEVENTEITLHQLTDPNLVPEFIEKTGIDALAVSFGTAHGFYVKEPELNFDLLAEINKKTETPLVLHGGTGLPDDAFLQAIKLGIRKINYGTDIFAVATQAATRVLAANPELIYYSSISQEIRHAVTERSTRYMHLWQSAQKSWLRETQGVGGLHG